MPVIPMPMRISFTGLLLLPTHNKTNMMDNMAPKEAKKGVLYAPSSGRPPQMMANTAPVLAPDDTPNT